jgi:hypothetical protein
VPGWGTPRPALHPFCDGTRLVTVRSQLSSRFRVGSVVPWILRDTLITHFGESDAAHTSREREDEGKHSENKRNDETRLWERRCLGGSCPDRVAVGEFAARLGVDPVPEAMPNLPLVVWAA